MNSGKNGVARENALPVLLYGVVVILSFLSVAVPQEGKEDTDPVLRVLQIHLEKKLVHIEPRVAIEIPDGYEGKTLILRYQVRTYLVYPSHKTGRLGKELQEQEGPDDEGVLLRVHVQEKGEVNQAAVPQTLRAPYWMTDLDVVPVESKGKQLFVAISYRGSTDKKLLATLRETLQSFGKEG